MVPVGLIVRRLRMRRQERSGEKKASNATDPEKAEKSEA